MKISILTIAWRLPWWVLAHFLRALLTSVMFMGWGRDQAMRVWKDTL